MQIEKGTYLKVAPGEFSQREQAYVANRQTKTLNIISHPEISLCPLRYCLLAKVTTTLLKGLKREWGNRYRKSIQIDRD